MKRRLFAVAASASLAMMAGVPTALATSGPPYTQCPAVGQSPSCAILLVVNADRTISIEGDTSAGQFDGTDDTLVGIVNNSSKPVNAIVVSGSGTDLAGFDDDGLCTFITCTWPAPTTYEGPGMSFVLDPTTTDRVEVDFTGGLQAGKSTYFSLEGALDAAAIKAAPGTITPNIYAALGDSFSAGEGNPPFQKGTDTSSDSCHRSNAAYGPLLAKLYSTQPILGSNFKACSGAITNDLFSTNHTNASEPDQISQIPTDAKLVTLTIGGNDVGFASVLAGCIEASYAPISCANNGAAKDAAKALAALSGGPSFSIKEDNGKYYTVHSWGSILKAIHSRASKAQILIAGYPVLIDPKGPGFHDGLCFMGWAAPFTAGGLIAPTYMSEANASWLSGRVDALNTALASAVKASGVANAHYVNVAPNFVNHGICDSTPWINKVTFTTQIVDAAAKYTTSPGSAHPNSEGQLSGYERAFADTLNSLP